MASTQVFAHYSQYTVVGGAEVDEDLEEPIALPGLAGHQGAQTVVVLTGVDTGSLTVETVALTRPPADVATGWDVIGELDIESPSGSIQVCDWAGPAHHELADLAGAGPGRYRLRIHARHRRAVEEAGSATTETHRIAAWPVTSAASALLLTPLDHRGDELTASDSTAAAPTDPADAAAVNAVDELIALVASGAPPVLSGERQTLRWWTALPTTRRAVRSVVAAPWTWLGTGGYPGGFIAWIARNRGDLCAAGTMLEDTIDRVSFTWAWCQSGPNAWKVPEPPITVSINLARAKGETAVDVTLTDVPTEVCKPTGAIWGWGVQRQLVARTNGSPLRLPPWGR